MSQKKLKKLRKLENIDLGVKSVESVSGIREILRKNWKFLLVLILGVVAIYFNSLWGGFVSDDYATVSQNSQVASITTAWTSGHYSFFVNLSKTVIAKVFGNQNPIPYHIFSLLVYLLICVLAFIFLSLFFGNVVVKVALVIFAVLPVHVEAISWISGIPYLLTSSLVLVCLINLVLFLIKKDKKYLFTLLFFLLIIFFTDRIRGFAFVLLSGLTLLSFQTKFKIKVNLLLVFSAILVATGALILIGWPLIQTRIGSVNSGVNVSDSIFYDPFFQYPTAIPKYLQMVLFPTDLTLYHTMYVIPDWFNWLVLLTYLTAVVWFYFKDKRFFFALAFVFVATAPSMAPVKVSWLVAERYVFLGSLGVALIFGLLSDRYWEKRKYLVVGILSAFVAAYSVRVILRNINWQTNHNLWVNTCQVSPNSHNAWNNIGDDYDKLSQYDNAVKGFGMSFAVKQNYADAYHNQANIFYKIGRLDLARKGYEQTLYYNPALYQTYLTLIQLDLVENNKEELLKHIYQLNQAKPNDLQVAYITATAYAKIGMISEAKALSSSLYQQFPKIAEIKSLYDALQATPESTNSGLLKK
ncbi:MAG: hypothetical protein KIH89_001310 [Candidatus Shapirobacteria bacterium]|nr:hypothetical protein [Candidatus Shapirobacteria bacterium]